MSLKRASAVALTVAVFGAGAQVRELPNPYRLVEGWPTIPGSMNGGRWGEVIRVHVGSDGNIWVFHRCFNTVPPGHATCIGRGDSNPPILEFDPAGKLLKSFGLEAALGELPRPGKERRIRDDAIAWVQHCACQKPKELGYSYELWTYSLLQEHVRKHCLGAGHPSLAELSRSRLHRILTQGEIRPHKIRYYVERRDPEFEAGMAVVLHVYKEVEIVNEELIRGTLKEPPVVTISCDEKPGIQALATTTPDLAPAPRKFRSHLRDYEYKRLGTVSLLAGLDIHTGRVTEIVSEHHASADFIALLSKLDEGYPPQTRIRLLLDNHSAHISKETRGWLSLHPNRFEFVFTPKHGSWLNIVETMFGKMARSMLRGIRVASKQELIDRIHLYFQHINADPVIFRWKYKMEETLIG